MDDDDRREAVRWRRGKDTVFDRAMMVRNTLGSGRVNSVRFSLPHAALYGITKEQFPGKVCDILARFGMRVSVVAHYNHLSGTYIFSRVLHEDDGFE